MAILLIRHGETPGNRDRIIQFPHTPLSERGLEQAARLGQRLASEPIGEIWVSDHARARMTAEAVERTTGAPLRVVEALAERNLGALRGTPYSELDFDPHAPDYVPPEGESWAVFHDRVDRVWAEVERHWLEHFAAREEAAHLAVVTHGLVLRSLFERRLFAPAERDRRANEHGQIAVANTGVSIVEPRHEAGRIIEHHIPLLACVAHLDEATAPRVNPNVGM
jgi:broad specificity phosphatase PhoE